MPTQIARIRKMKPSEAVYYLMLLAREQRERETTLRSAIAVRPETHRDYADGRWIDVPTSDEWWNDFLESTARHLEEHQRYIDALELASDALCK